MNESALDRALQIRRLNSNTTAIINAAVVKALHARPHWCCV